MNRRRNLERWARPRTLAIPSTFLRMFHFHGQAQVKDGQVSIVLKGECFEWSRRLGIHRSPNQAHFTTTRDGKVERPSIPFSYSVFSTQDTINVPNIILYGETGVGKSSIINLIAGRELTHTSNDALGCTFQHQRYIVEPNGMSCALWDTTGLDEGSEGTVPAAQAESNLRSLIQDLANTGGIHLVVYCVRATRLTKALQRNYDLFYVTVCRKKVPVALVVTGLEHQQGDMETWWAANEAVLRRYGMRFDAHACVTTLEVDDHVIQQRRYHSQRLLRELVIRYSMLPAWKAEPSFISSVLPMLRTALHKTLAAGRTKKSITIRRVVICDMASASNTSTTSLVKLSPDIPLGTHTEWVQIEGRSYEFIHVDKRMLRMRIPQAQHVGTIDVGSGAGVLVFYTSPLGSTAIPQEELDMLEVFYEIAGGQTCPMLVVLRGCDNEERATRECRNLLASRHKNIQAYFTTFSNQKLTEMIEGLCIEHVEVKIPTVYKAYAATKHWLVTAVETVISRDFVPCRRRRGKVTPGTGPTT